MKSNLAVAPGQASREQEVNVNDIGKRASALGVEIADIHGLVTDLNGIGQAQAKYIDGASRASADMSRANKSLSTSMNGTKISADRARDILSYSAEKVAATVEGTSAKMRTLSESAISFKETLGTVDDTVKNVQSASVSISQIARETQLLSLNASVEAARAGDSGKGFAIIATAVKGLADEIQGFANQNAEHLEKLMSILSNLHEMSASNVEIATGAIEEAKEAAKTGEQLNELVHSVGELVNDIEGMAQPVEDNARAAESIKTELNGLGKTVKVSEQKLRVANSRSENILGISEDLMLFIAASGAQTDDTKFIDAAKHIADEVASVFEQALSSREISENDLFDTRYAPIQGTDPQQMTTRYLWLTDQRLVPIQEAALNIDARIAFCAAVDTNGYLPTHNLVYSKPQTHDPVWNAGNCRNRRIFDDRTGLGAGQNTRPFLLQTYRRDMGGGNFALMKDVSAPIYVNGRHWGGVRIGYKV